MTVNPLHEMNEADIAAMGWDELLDERQALADLALAADDWVSQEELEAAKYTQLRIRRTTLQNLRMIYALTGESMIAVTERLAEQELQRLAGVKPTEMVQIVSRVEGEV